MKKFSCLILLLLTGLTTSAQSELDSLWKVWKDPAQNDTAQLVAIRQYIRKGPLFTNPDTAIIIANEQYRFAESIRYGLYMADARNTQGIANAIQNRYDVAIEYYMEALKIYEKIDNKSGQASILNNIGILYSDMDEYDKSLEYYQKSAEVKKEIGDTLGLGSTYNNMGVIYRGKEDYHKALELYFQCLDIEMSINNEKEYCSTYNNIAVAYKKLDSLDKAQYYFELALDYALKFNSENNMANVYNGLASLEIDRKNWNKAREYAEKAHYYSSKISGSNNISLAHDNLYTIYKNLGDYKKALEHYEIFIDLKAKQVSEQNQRAVIQQEYKYTYEKQAAADSVRNEEQKKVQQAQLEAQKAETARQKQQSYYLYGGLGLAAIFGFFMFNRYRLTQKQKRVIEEQKEQVDLAFEQLEEKNTEILDSINYAKRIQTAILPPEKLWKENLKESFVLYKPKDIVAGDFYWMEPTPSGVLFAAADCTGHGVPGAMVSVVCNNSLNRSVREFKLKEPAKILDKTRELVIQEFEKSADEVKDGMDIALVSLERHPEPVEGQAKVSLSFAGAHNSLWIIRKGATEIKEIKADKQPIGKFQDATAFTNHQLVLNEGDSFYIYSDGYADQFGGDKGKKFKASSFKALLLEIVHLPMADQKERLNEAFESWKGQLEQLDDVCVIGVRI
ncbi:MAG: tetratricopeptide repeat protein [Crocinitomicaceae bacterium]|nr:tetratricopeptide repeat protein [Crocinitomicaceae bacterium]